MKVVVIGPSDKFRSGVSYHTKRLAKAIGADTILFRNMLPKFLFPGSIRVNGNEGSIDWYNPFTWVGAAKECNQHDIVIFQWWTSSVGHMYFFISLIVRKPTVIEFHEVVDPMEDGFLPLRLYSRWIGKAIRKRASAYVVHSTKDQLLIADNYQIPIEKITVIPLGLFDQYTRTPNKKGNVILFFGLIRPYKGVKYIIEAFNQIPGATLLIVGEMWEEKITISHDRITLIDRYVSDEETQEYFSMADVLVLPYTRASQSGVAHIGMAMGLPIVASYVGGLTESLVNYKGNHFVEPCNVEQLRDGIISALSGERHFEPPSELKWENVSKEWRDLFEQLSN